jgi:hypothetical protein
MQFLQWEFSTTQTCLQWAGVKALPTNWEQLLNAFKKVKAAGMLPLGNAGGNGPALEQLHASVGPTFYGGTQFFNDVAAGKEDIH